MFPGAGAVGLVGAALLSRNRDICGNLGRFTIAATLVTLLVYVPYFYRDPRFLMIPSVLGNVCAAVLVATLLAKLRGKLALPLKSAAASPHR